jgi:hypothetical protein
MRGTIVLVALVAGGCDPHARFGDRAVLWWDHDDKPGPVPAKREAMLQGPGVDDELFRSLDRVLSIDYGKEALNANALDEVPNSTWFEDPRRDRDDPGRTPHPRALGADALELGGPAASLGPDRSAPLLITRAKTAGATLGLEVRDARGQKFLLKLDPVDWPQIATSTEVVATHLVWAAGWRVPMMTLIELNEGDLQLAPDAKTRDRWGHEIPFTSDKLKKLLRRTPINGDGTFLALASRWLDGVPLGPFNFYGRRHDDVNDRIAHEDRRELRGFGVFSMWINNIDTQELNGLDMYLGERGRGHVVHYQQDVGGSFGSRAVGPTSYWMGTENYFSGGRILRSMVTLGLPPRPWEGARVAHDRERMLAQWPELGFFDADHFEPQTWRPLIYNPAFARQTDRDRYWGAKRVVMFSGDEIRGAIRAGRYRPETAQRLFDILWQRREKIARAYFSNVAPLDYFRLDGERLCFDDLWIEAGLGGERATEYQAAGAQAGEGRCVTLGRAVGYRVVELRARRPGERHFGPPVRVHLVEEAAGARHIVGIER